MTTIVYVSASCPWSAKFIDEMRQADRTEAIRDVAHHAPPPTVRAVPSVVLGDGTVHSGEAAFAWLRAQPHEVVGVATSYDGLGFLCLETNAEDHSETFTWIGDDSAPAASAAASPADPMLERLLSQRAAEVSAPIVRQG